MSNSGIPIAQSGSITPGHVVMWTTDGVAQDAGPATEGNLSEVGITADGGISLGINSGAVSGPYVEYGVGVSHTGTVTVYVNSFGGAPTATLYFNINGAIYAFNPAGGGNVTGPVSAVSGNVATFNGTGGNLIEDGGFSVSSAMQPVVGAATTPDAIADLYLPGQNVNVFLQTGDTGHLSGWVWNVINAGDHTTTDNSAVAISYRPVGAGIAGPEYADYGLTVSVVKDSYLTSSALGEVDGITVITRQGSDDTAAYLANVGVVAGFGVILEGECAQLEATTGDVLASCDCQIGGIETGFTGTQSYIGYVFSATVGTWTGLQLQAQNSATIDLFITCFNNSSTTIFQVEGTGAVYSISTFNGTGYMVDSNQVVGARNTGWTAGTGASPNKGAIDYDTATLSQLADRVLALEQALFVTTGHGLIGP